MGKIVKKEKTIEHPLEATLGIDPGTTVVEFNEVAPTDIVVVPTYDEKDREIEDQFQEIYDTAMGSALTLSDEIERVEGKYKARMSEVSATMLTVALSAAKEKMNLKAHKDKTSVDRANAGTAKTVNNNLIVADRNEILRTIMSGGKPE